MRMHLCLLIWRAACGNTQYTDGEKEYYPITPTFQDIPGIDDNSNISGRIDTVIDAFSASSGKRTEKNYYRCTLIINNVTFSGSYAIGSGLTFGSGGAIYAYKCDVVLSTNCCFNSSQASVGGALSLIDSQLLTESDSIDYPDTTFIHCFAYHMAGALFFSDSSATVEEAVKNGFPHSHANAFIKNAKFLECCSKEFHGAASFSCVQDLYLENTYFIRCSAGHSGGAMGIAGSITCLNRCQFVENNCSILTSVSNTTKGLNARATARKLGIPKGGGAIVILTTTQPAQNNSHSAQLIDLVTISCCFSGNCAYNNITIDVIDGVYQGNGCDILFCGQCYWRSYTDKFGLSESNAIGFVSRTTDTSMNTILWGLQWSTPNGDNSSSFEQSNICESSDFNGTTINPSFIWITASLSVITVASQTDFTAVAAFPSPSIFAYPSTPLTRLPYATTKSATSYSGTPQKRTFSVTSIKIQSPTPSRTRSPSRSSYLQVPMVSATADTNSMYTEGPTASYFWEVPATAQPTKTSNGATWPSQTPTKTYNTPTQSSYGWVPPTASSLWAVPDASPIATISFQFEPPSTPTPSPSKSLGSGEYFVKKTSETLVASPTATVTLTMSYTLSESYSIALDIAGQQTYVQVPVYTLEVLYVETYLITLVQSEVIFDDLATISTDTSSDYELSKGLIIGLSVGAGVIVMVISAVVVFVLRGGANKNVESSADTEEDLEDIPNLPATAVVKKSPNLGFSQDGERETQTEAVV